MQATMTTCKNRLIQVAECTWKNKKIEVDADFAPT